MTSGGRSLKEFIEDLTHGPLLSETLGTVTVWEWHSWYGGRDPKSLQWDVVGTLPPGFTDSTLGLLAVVQEQLRSEGERLVKQHGKAPRPSWRGARTAGEQASEDITEQDVGEALQRASGGSAGGSDISDAQVGEAIERAMFGGSSASTRTEYAPVTEQAVGDALGKTLN